MREALAWVKERQERRPCTPGSLGRVKRASVLGSGGSPEPEVRAQGRGGAVGGGGRGR